MNLAVSRHQRHRYLTLGSDLDLEVRSVRIGSAEHEVQGNLQPAAPKGIASLLLRHKRSGPTNQLAHGGGESLSPPRQLVAALLVAGNHAAFLEMTQALGQKIGRDAGEPVLQVAIATGTV